MCEGPVLDVVEVGEGTRREDLPEIVRPYVVTDSETDRVAIMAWKVGRPTDDPGRFEPLTRRESFGRTARAVCGAGVTHEAPDPYCTCGFHAVSHEDAVPTSPTGSGRPAAPMTYRTYDYWKRTGRLSRDGHLLQVALTGRIVVCEWSSGLLFRAAVQTIVAVEGKPYDEWVVSVEAEHFILEAERLLRLEARGWGEAGAAVLRRSRPGRGAPAMALRLPDLSEPLEVVPTPDWPDLDPPAATWHPDEILGEAGEAGSRPSGLLVVR